MPFQGFCTHPVRIITLGTHARQEYSSWVVSLSVGLGLNAPVVSSFILHTYNDTAYLTHNKGVKFCGISSAVYSCYTYKLTIFPSADKCLCIPEGFALQCIHYHSNCKRGAFFRRTEKSGLVFLTMYILS